MTDSPVEKITDLSFLEKLKNQDIFQLLLNALLYITLILPILETVKIPAIHSPWKDISNEILVVFLLVGFGCVYWISFYVMYFLKEVRSALEMVFFRLLHKIGLDIDNDKETIIDLYLKNNGIVTMREISMYLLCNENKWMEKIYAENVEMKKIYYSRREATEVTLILFAGHFFFDGTTLKNLIQQLPWLLPVSKITLLWLLYSSSKPYPLDMDYVYLPGNPVRDSNSCKSD
jgi:hypothetical protein